MLLNNWSEASNTASVCYRQTGGREGRRGRKGGEGGEGGNGVKEEREEGRKGSKGGEGGREERRRRSNFVSSRNLFTHSYVKMLCLLGRLFRTGGQNH